MQLFSMLESQISDKITIEKYLSGYELMENAAKGFSKILSQNEQLDNKRILIVCGPGNNGGDGFAIAKLIYEDVKSVEILFLGDSSKLSKEAYKNYTICKENSINFINIIEDRYDIFIDSIFGVGLNRNIEGKYYDIINLSNSINARKYSVDIPSGVSSNDGEIFNIAFKADITISFNKAKIGSCLYPGREYSGEIEIIDIGIPKNIYEHRYKTYLIEKEYIKIKKRKKTANKYDCGKVMVIAGSIGMSGAAYMSAQSALESGAGSVVIVIPKSINSILEIKTTEVMTKPIDDKNKGFFNEDSLEDILNFENSYRPDSIIIGPGLGRDKDTIKFVNRYLKQDHNAQIIVDADGLYAIKENIEEIKRKDYILTPHDGEFSKLIKKNIKNRYNDLHNYIKGSSNIVVLKGADTIIANSKDSYINSSGNPGMAVAGMGDVLAGLIGSFCAQGYNKMEACNMSVYIHGYIADRLSENMYENSITPTKIIENLGKYLKDFE